MWKDYKILIIGIVSSVILLITLFLLKFCNSSLLSLEIKWIAFSGIPVLLSLFIGGYIKTFKGFGIEVEANLNKPISSNFNLITQLETEEIPGAIKGRVSSIRRLSENQILEIKRITFIYGKSGYYNEEAINEYLHRFPNLKYIEITDSRRKFKYLLPIGILKEGSDNLYWDNNHRFIAALENKTIPQEYPNFYESKFVKWDESTLNVYKKLKMSYLKTLPVTNNKNEMVGLVDYNRTAIQIADEIIALKN